LLCKLLYVSYRVKREGVDAAISKEIEIAKDLLRQENKPEAMLDNIAKVNGSFL
jgi:DUF917 family protein